MPDRHLPRERVRREMGTPDDGIDAWTGCARAWVADRQQARAEAAEAEVKRLRTASVLSAIAASHDAECPRPFALDRMEDETGVSGTGVVAYGCQFADGRCVLRWRSEHRSTAVYDSLGDLEAVHGHDGHTRVVWLAADFGEFEEIEAERDELKAKLGRLTALLAEVETEADMRPHDTATVRVWQVRAALDGPLRAAGFQLDASADGEEDQ